MLGRREAGNLDDPAPGPHVARNSDDPAPGRRLAQHEHVLVPGRTRPSPRAIDDEEDEDVEHPWADMTSTTQGHKGHTTDWQRWGCGLNPFLPPSPLTQKNVSENLSLFSRNHVSEMFSLPKKCQSAMTFENVNNILVGQSLGLRPGLTEMRKQNVSQP